MGNPSPSAPQIPYSYIVVNPSTILTMLHTQASTPDSDKFNQNSFPVKMVLRRSLKSDLSTIRTIALSPDGVYLVSGFDSGLVEVAICLIPTVGCSFTIC
jgi:WD40 repeat protein